MDNEKISGFAKNIISTLIDGAGKLAANKLKQDKTKFNDSIEKEIMQRDSQYTVLLKNFVKISEIRNCIREIMKWLSSICILIASGILLYIFWIIINRILQVDDINKIIDTIPLLITSIVSFLSVVIVVPLTMLKYLFSNKEDEYITQVILHTQEHDMSGRQWTLDKDRIKIESKIENDEEGQEAN